MNPAAFIGRSHELGRLAPGYRANLVAFDPNKFRVVESWVAGYEGTPDFVNA
jgi:N-acetylglucosamine-6-phosphate deacetylase